MIAEKVNFEKAKKILRSLGYLNVEINCIKSEEVLREVMLIEGYREGYNCWVMADDIDPELDLP